MEPPPPVGASAARKLASRNRPHLKDLNEHIVCPLCRGYLVDATTLVECLHSFCRGCIIRRLSAGGPRACPTCNASVLAPPVPDVGLQRLVYLVVPGLFRSELERRRHFCQVNPQCTSQPPMGAPDLCFDDLVSLSLCEVDGPPANSQPNSAKYFKCPAGVTVRHLVRLLMLKMGWDTPNDCGVQCGNNKIEMMYEIGGAKDEVEVLDPSWTLMDLACIFEWKRETPMNLLYRIIRVDKTTPAKPATNCYVSNSSGSGTTPTATNPDTSNQAIENIQRPPTPPPSPKPTISRMDQLDKSPRSATVVDQYSSAKEHEASKKPRCEVTPVMRAPDPPPIEDRSRSGKPPKLEHQHKRKKKRNKRVIAEITTTPREDLLKLKVRLTPCPPRDTKDKLMQIRSARKEKLKGSSQKHRTREHKESVEIEEIMEVDKVEEEKKEEKEEEKKIESGKEEVTEKMEISPVIPVEKETIKVVEIEKVPEPAPVEKVEEPKKQPVREESPKNEEVLRRLGLVATSEVTKNRQERVNSPARSGDDKADPALEREKLEKQFRESKANRVRSLLAEKQMRDTLKSIMSNSKESTSSSTTAPPTPTPAPAPQQQQQQPQQQPSTSTRSATPTTNSAKRKEPPPLTPLRSAKRANVTFAPTTFTAGKFESPLDLSRPQNLSKDVITSGMSDVTITRCNPEDVPVSILKNSLSRAAAAAAMDKPKDEPRKTQDLNLRTLSDAAVSLIDRTGVDKSKLPASFVNLPGSSIGKSVALKIPQPHQRITGFGVKIKPNIGVRHIPNPQAIVASQYRHQRAGYFHMAAHHHQPP